MGENQCQSHNHVSNSKINSEETTTAQYATMLRKLPFIGNLLANLSKLELPIDTDFNTTRISPILIRFTITAIFKLAIVIYFYHYIIIKLFWQSIFGQDLKMIFKYI